MISNNSLYQQIHQLDQHISSFAYQLNETAKIDQLGALEGPFESLNSVLQSSRALFYELEKHISSKIDRIEFGQIVHLKANTADVQKVIMDIIQTNNLMTSQRLATYLEQSAEDHHESQEFNIHQAHVGKKRRNRSVGHHHNHVHSYEQTAANSPMAMRNNCSQCAIEGEVK